MLHLERRELFATAISAAALATLPTNTAEAQSPLNNAELRNLVTSQRERTLVFLYMDFTIYALLPYIFAENANLESYDDFAKTKEGSEWEGSLQSLNTWLTQFYDRAFESALLQALDSERADELMTNAVNNAEELVERIATAFAQLKIQPNEGVGSEALRAVKTVEQLNALESSNVPDKPFLCGFFPFSYFCD